MNPEERLEIIKQLKKRVGPIASYDNLEKIANPGIYSVWWTGELMDLQGIHRNVCLQGKQVTIKERENGGFVEEVRYHIHEIEWDWNLDFTPVCLYVGKASNIKKRVKQHLELNTQSEEWYTTPYKIRRNRETNEKMPNVNEDFLVKRTSACQVRTGIEHLYKKMENVAINEKLHNIGISFIGEEHFNERFYLEDLAIGYYASWFNLDSER